MPQHSSYQPEPRTRGRRSSTAPTAAWVVVSGADRRSYLHGLLTNDIAALEAGQGCYAAYLTPQGRMIADLWVYELGDVMLLSLARDVKDAVLARLDQFIFTEDVQLGDVTETFAATAIVGPRAARRRRGRDRHRRSSDWRSCRSTATCASTSRGSRRSCSRRPTPASQGSTCSSERPACSGAARAASRSRRRRCRCGRRRGAAHRGGRAEVSPRHGRGDDSARGRHRGARDQPDQGLLRRAGSHHPRAAPRPWPRRAQARRADARTARLPRRRDRPCRPTAGRSAR